MPQITIPLTTYQIKQSKPSTPLGSPATLSLRDDTGVTQKVLIRVPIDQIPVDAIVTSANVEFWSAAAKAGAAPIRIFPVTEKWKSSVTWQSRPALDAAIATVTVTDGAADSLYSFPVTSWVATRSRKGLALDTTLSTAIKLRGSSAAKNKPVLVVDYYVGNAQPVGLSPQGGAVSVPTPILTYTGDRDMDHQQVQYSSDGTVPGIVFDSGSVPATTGRYVPVGGEPVLTAGESVFWRVMTSGGGGESIWSPWVEYSYEPIEEPVITNPPSTTDDGSPTITWTVSDQVSWQAELRQGSQVLSSSGWDVNSATRDWTPPVSNIPVPGGQGTVVLRVTDSVTPRVAAEDAPIWAEVSKDFTTVLGDGSPGITDLAVTYEEPVPVITGTRVLGVPDEIALLRDGKIVTLWDADGNPRTWAPGADFFDGTEFTLLDYSANSRQEHSWAVLVRIDGEASAASAEVTGLFVTGSVWIVNPRTGAHIEILGDGGVPVVSQVTEESSVLHTPVHGDLVVEPVRRRLMRTTRAGSIEGLVLNDDEDTLGAWALSDSSLKYRLIFGKVNWSIIFGDYTPTDVFYTHPDPRCDDTVVLIGLNWWERLAD